MQITDHVPNLVGGITQQPPETRIKTAVEEMVNAYPSAIQGLSKRRGAQFVSSLTSTALGTTSFHHTIDRDEQEKYIVITNSDGSVEVYDLNGVQQSVTVNPTSAAYLTSTDPSTNIRAVTAGDYTFLANKNVTTAIQTDTVVSNEATNHAVTLDLMDRLTSEVPFTSDSVYKAVLEFKQDVTLSDGTTETLTYYPLGTTAAYDQRYYRKADRYTTFSGTNIYDSSNYSSATEWERGETAPAQRDFVYRRGLYELDGRPISAYSNVSNFSNVTGSWINLDSTDPAFSVAAAAISTGFTESGDNFNVSNGYKVLRSTNSDAASSSAAVTHVALQLRDGQAATSTDTVTGHTLRYADIYAARLASLTGSNRMEAIDSEGTTHYLGITSASSNSAGNVTIATDSACYISNAYEIFNGATYTTYSAFTGASTAKSQSVFPQNTANPSNYRLEIIIGHDRVLSTGATERFFKKYTGTRVDNGSTAANIVYQLQGQGGANLFQPEDSEGTQFQVDLSTTSYVANTGEIKISSTTDFFIYGVNELLNNLPISEVTPTFSGRKVTDFDDLADKGSDGEVVQITGQSATDEDDYFVTYQDGRWTETLAPESAEQFDTSTMPQALVRGSDGNWTVEPYSWRGREVGSAVANETPSFLGKKITDLFLFQGRLGVCAGESLVLSETDYFEQFYRSTCIQLEDDNRIDVSLNFGRVESIHAALAVQDNLILFSDKGQFRMYSGSGVLTPKTATVIQIGDYATSTAVRPHAIGKSAFFTSELGGFTIAREFFLGAATDDRLLSSDLTIQCPQYVQGNARYIQASRDNKAIFVLSRDDPTAVYVYKFEYDGETKIQSAWCKWTLGVGTIESFGLFQNYLYIVSSLGTERELTKIDIRDQQDIPGTELMRLDMQVAATTPNSTVLSSGVSGTSEDPETQITIPYDGTGLVECWDLSNGHTIPITSFTSSGNLILKGDYQSQIAAGKIVIGIPYTMDVKLSTIYRRAPRKPSGEIVVNDGRLTINYITVAYTDTVAFTVETSSRGRSTKTFNSGPKVGFVDVKFGEVPKTSGHLRVPIMTRNDNAEIRIKNDTPFASNILHLDWFGKHNPRARRV